MCRCARVFIALTLLSIACFQQASSSETVQIGTEQCNILSRRSADFLVAVCSSGQYSGQWDGFALNGSGSYIFSDVNISYNGNWRNGCRDGEGAIYYGSGFTFYGQYLNDFRHGKGSITYAPSFSLGGLWQHGKFDSVTRVIIGKEPVKNPDPLGPVYKEIEGEYRDGKIYDKQGNVVREDIEQYLETYRGGYFCDTGINRNWGVIDEL